MINRMGGKAAGSEQGPGNGGDCLPGRLDAGQWSQGKATHSAGFGRVLSSLYAPVGRGTTDPHGLAWQVFRSWHRPGASLEQITQPAAG